MNACANYMCVKYGCQGHCGAYFPTLPAPQQFQFGYPPVGCICPPASEKTCESKTCPRKDHTAEAQKHELP